MSDDRDELLPSTRRALDLRLARAQSEGRAPSMAAGLVRDGRLVWSGGRGRVDGAEPTADTQYRIGSITKTFVALLVLRLRVEGLVDLGEPLERYLPGTPAGRATLRQLLSHSAGLPAETPPPWWERTPGSVRPELSDLLADRALPAQPGQLFHYSNVGFALLGALVERLRGRPWVEVLTAEVLQPLGMTRTTPLPAPPHARGWAVHPWSDVLLPEPSHDAGRMAPAGQLWSTVNDLGRLATLLLDGDERVLSAGTLAEMRRPVAPPSGTGQYGLGLHVSPGERTLVGHGGSMPGFLAGIDVCVEEGLGVVVFANATSGPAVGATAEELLGILADAEPQLPPAWTPLPQADPDLLALTGPWYWGAAPFALRLLADRELELVTLGDGGRESRFRPEADGSWTGLEGYYTGERLRVVTDGAGAVSHLDLASFVLTREPYGPAEVIPGGLELGGWGG